jgi:cell division transport system permease protein
VRFLWHALYFARRAVESLIRGPRVAFVATGTLFVALLVTGLFAAAFHGAQRLIGAWGGEVQLSVYLDPGADLDAARAAVQAAAPGRQVEAVGAEEALRRFRAALGPQGALVDGVRPGIIPPSIEVRAPGITFEEARSLATRLAAVPGAQDVDYGSAWLEPFQRLVGHVRWAGVALLAALAAGAAILVANTLQLGVFGRRDEIEIMRLFGATDFFVEVPFLIEGLLQGVFGGALAAGALLATARSGLPWLSRVLGPVTAHDVLPSSTLLGLVGGGAVLGVVASALAVRRELRRRR